jgi:hypothetical protein
MEERGSFRPGWIAVAIVTCVLFGSTMNRCLTCGKPLDAAEPVVPEAGTPFVQEQKPAQTWEPKPKPPEPEPAAKPQGLEDYEDVTFDKLGSYKYEMEELHEGDAPKEQIPDSIHALSGRKIAIKGFMIPYRNNGESVTEFILLRNQGLCCFGTVPRMNEWIHVAMAPGKGAPYAMDVPITVFGTLDVKETWDKSKDPDPATGTRRLILMSVYRMEAVAVIVPPVYR